MTATTPTIIWTLIASTLAGLLILVGCAAPGSPPVRSSEGDGEGPLAKGCQNVSITSRGLALPDEFITTSYLTTWVSAWGEGAAEGYREGSEEALESGNENISQPVEFFDSVVRRPEALARLQLSPASKWDEEVNALSQTPMPFCRVYSASASEVLASIREVFDRLDYPIALVDEEYGFFETEFVERNHQAAIWRDRYVLTVATINPNQSLLMVYRNIYISRSGDIFNEAISVGHNETWILRRVDEDLQ